MGEVIQLFTEFPFSVFGRSGEHDPPALRNISVPLAAIDHLLVLSVHTQKFHVTGRGNKVDIKQGNISSSEMQL